MGISSLDAALTGMRLAQQQIGVISNNVANATTPGFSRKILPQTAQSIQGVTVGVLAGTITRNVDLNLERDLWTQISSTGNLNVKENYLSRIEQFHGPPDKELSVAAELSRLHDAFAALSDTPEDTFLLASVVNQAEDTANKINSLSRMISTLRNDAQDEVLVTIDRINALTSQIAELNGLIRSALNSGNTAAQLQDQRDGAINELSGLIEISFFTRGDGVLVVQTNEGVELAAEQSVPLTTSTVTVLGPSSYYPNSAFTVYAGDPNVNASAAVDITVRNVGGKLGGLLELRDETFPKQMAQIDELAHKIALRFQDQGLLLFTDAAGTVPLDTPPDPTTLPNPTPVEYVGFSASIRVNTAVIADHTLIQSGTNVSSSTVQPGSNEVIARVLEYTFGSVEFQQAIGTIDMRTSLQAPPNDTLQNWLGLYSEAQVNGTVDLTAYATVADIVTAGGATAFGTVAPPAETDRFTITFDDPDYGTGPHTVTIDLRAVPVVGPTAADDLVAFINADANFANAVADFNASVSVGSNGQLVFDSRSDITIAAAGAEPMSSLGFAFLGLNPGTTEAVDPYFDVAVGTNTQTRITIDPNDNENDLFAQLSAVPGLAVEDFTASVDGLLRMRPGENYTTPEYGGGLSITGGPFQVNGAGIGAGTLPDGLNIVSALFGSFSAGPPVQDNSPITDVAYGSQTNGSLAPPIPEKSFRTDLLGPNTAISTEIIGSTRIIDFSQKMISQHSQELNIIRGRAADEETLKEVLQSQFLNDSGVNIDEELGNLVIYQTQFAAAARVITAVDESFRQLLDALR